MLDMVTLSTNPLSIERERVPEPILERLLEQTTNYFKNSLSAGYADISNLGDYFSIRNFNTYVRYAIDRTFSYKGKTKHIKFYCHVRNNRIIFSCK